MQLSRFFKKSTLKFGVLSLIGLTSLFVARPSQAATIINGGFESGDFSGWTTLGNTSIQTAAFGSGPVEGTFQALLLNGDAADPLATFASDLEEFLGLTFGSLDTLGNGAAFDGSAIQQTFTAQAGQVLSFKWNFLTNELAEVPPLNDFAFVQLGTLSELADTNSTFVLSTTALADETGFNTFSYTIPTTGTYTLGLGVVDVDDPIIISGLLIDDVALSDIAAVPEPGSILGLLAVSSFGIACFARSKQQKAASEA